MRGIIISERNKRTKQTARLPGRKVRQQRPAPAEQSRGTANEIKINTYHHKGGYENEEI
jgi:hypothetical protein